MKWYDRVNITGLSLLAFLGFLLLSYISKEKEWWPELFMILAEAALSVVIVLRIIEVWSRKEKTRRWEKVKLLMYSEILDGFFGIYISVFYYILPIERILMQENVSVHKNQAETLNDLTTFMRDYQWGQDLHSKSSKSAPYLRTLAKQANTTYRQIIIAIIKSEDKKIKSHFNYILESTNVQIDEIIILINEYRMLIPRALELSDDEDLGLILQKSEISGSRLIGAFRKQKNIKPTLNDIASILKLLSDFLYTAANLCDLIEQKTKAEKEISWKKDITQKLKCWWLPSSCWE
jgi:hypothetical protein